MQKNTIKIRNGIKELVHKPYEIISGKVVAGSLNEESFTFSVQPSNGGKAIEGVLLNTVIGDGNGLVLFPADGSDVVIGSIDGNGEWILLRAGEVIKTMITIGNATISVENSDISMRIGTNEFNIGTSVYKLNTASESLFALLRDLITYITEINVPTSGGASGIPINILDFNNLLIRLNNLLSA